MNLQGFFTQKGRELEMKTLSGTALIITRATAGSGETLPDATALNEEKQVLAVGAFRRAGSTVMLPVTLAAQMSETSYPLTEVGLYAQDPEEGEILYRVYRLSQPLNITAGSRQTIRFELENTFSDTPDTMVPASAAGLLNEGMLAVPGGIATLDADGTIPVVQMSYTYGTEDLVAGTTPLESGQLHFVYE